MARPIWKGSLSFGLVTIPVTLYSAENRQEELHFSLLDKRNNARVKYKRVNEATGEEVPWDTIVKGYEYEDGNYVLLGDEDFRRAAVEATQTVALEQFVPRDSVECVYYDKPYYLVPLKGGEKAYVLLRDVLAKTGKIGIATVVIRTRQYIAALVPEGDALVVNLLRYEYELRKPREMDLPEILNRAGKPKPQEMAMAEQLVAAMAGEFNPGKFHDEYRDKLVAWINKKVKAGDLAPAAAVPGEEEEAAPAPINIMDLLKRSVEGQEGAPRRAASTRGSAGRAAEGRAKPSRKPPAPSTRTKHGTPHAHRKKAG
jgi:DNA end-binding protein Ku